ncbi:MAG: asparaginase [Candidatus Poribacteria bacterium]
MRPLDTVPLIETTRGTITETVHRGAIAVVDTKGNLQYAAGNPELVTFMRSAAKPFQLLPTIEAQAIEKFKLKPAEISVMCASHSGEDFHLELVRQILKKTGLTEEALQCGPHLPGHMPTQLKMIRNCQEPTAIHSNCSGKHTGMLMGCQIKGFPTEGYLGLSHPIQQEILHTVAKVGEMSTNDIGVAIDGCGVPTFALPIDKIALLFSRLADPSLTTTIQRQKGLNNIRNAMIAYPKNMSGSGRFCAALMQQFPNQVVLKSGAAGVYGIGLPNQGLGIGLKIENGLGEPRYAAVLTVLRKLDLLPRDGLDRLWHQFCPSVKNYHHQTVGETRPVFQLTKKEASSSSHSNTHSSS